MIVDRIVYAKKSLHTEKPLTLPIMSEKICVGLNLSTNNLDFGDVGGII